MCDTKRNLIWFKVITLHLQFFYKSERWHKLIFVFFYHQSAIWVGAPHKQSWGVTVSNTSWMWMTCTDCRNFNLIFLEEFDFLWYLMILSITMPKLSIFAIPPRKHSSLRGKRHCVLPTACHLWYLNFNQVFNRSRDRVIFCVAMTQLPKNPSTPCQQHPIFGDSSCMMIPGWNLNKLVLWLHWLWHFFITFFAISTPTVFSWAPHVHLWRGYLYLGGFRKKCLHHFHLTFLDHLDAIRCSGQYLIFFIIIVSSDRLECSSLRIQYIMSVKHFRW